MQSRVDRQLRALALAKACAACGARVRTIGHLTGLPPREALRLLFPDRMAVPRGRSPDSPEWYHGANLLHRAEENVIAHHIAQAVIMKIRQIFVLQTRRRYPGGRLYRMIIAGGFRLV